MRFIFSVFCLVMVGGVIVSSGQERGDRPATRRAVVVPRNVGLATIASQPDSPLQIESAIFVAYLGGGGGEVFQVRNRTSRPIRNYTVAVLSSNNTGWQSDWPKSSSSGFLMPGGLSPSSIETDGLKLMPLTKDVGRQLNLDGPMQGVSVLMVVRAEFADGMVFDDTKTFKALQAHFTNIANHVDRTNVRRALPDNRASAKP